MPSAKPLIAVAGAGRMGRGIAHVFAYAGFPVALGDIKDRPTAEAANTLKAARAEIARDLAFQASLGLLNDKQTAAILSRIDFLGRDGFTEPLSRAAVVFEAVPEVLEAKEQAYGLLCQHATTEAVISSTTSTLGVDTLAGCVTEPARFLNAHWLNPAHLIPLVEVSPGAATSAETVTGLKLLLEQAGKVPVVCTATPGYIVPRIQALAMNEAARMVEEGVASAEDIDKAIQVGFGVRYAVMGLLEFVDWGGGDILYYASKSLGESLNAERFAMPEIVQRNMAEGKLGISTGEGFHDFRDLDVDKYREEKLAKFIELIKHLGLMPPPCD